MDTYVDLLQWSINFSIKKTSGSESKNENISNKQLAAELHKPVIRKFNKRKVHSLFIDNIWGSDLAEMQINLIEDLDFYYVLLTFIANMHKLFL